LLQLDPASVSTLSSPATYAHLRFHFPDEASQPAGYLWPLRIGYLSTLEPDPPLASAEEWHALSGVWQSQATVDPARAEAERARMAVELARSAAGLTRTAAEQARADAEGAIAEADRIRAHLETVRAEIAREVQASTGQGAPRSARADELTAALQQEEADLQAAQDRVELRLRTLRERDAAVPDAEAAVKDAEAALQDAEAILRSQRPR
jgi:hypothetical protein